MSMCHGGQKESMVYLGATPELAIVSSDASAGTSPADIQILSLERVVFNAHAPFPLDSEATISFRIPRAPQAVATRIKIIRFEPSGKPLPYTITAVFTQLSDQDRSSITHCIEWYDIKRLFKLVIERGATDLHLIAGASPMIRASGELTSLQPEVLSEEDIKIFLYSILSCEQVRKFETDKEMDLGLQFDDEHRFRINIYQQRGVTQSAIRLIKKTLYDFDQLNIPASVRNFANLRDGLVLIVGPANSGKTTTIASMIDHINKNRKAVIITLERPIEYVHTNAQCVISQREIGVDSLSFSAALKASLRQDPNVLVVGELDDTDTIKTALVAAQAGFLVIASFHGPTAIQALDRLAGMFPGDQRKQILAQLSTCVEGVVAQLLLPRKDKTGRALATEVLVADDAVCNLIRSDQLHQLETNIQTGSAKGMQRMRASIDKLIQDGLVDAQTANFFTETFMKGYRE